ncbi:MAG: M1 family metallopeptidase [Flavobacteriaceae bacterium]|nr:M1 family metallopeptidase [Flavobacteriaceae bacterium]
MNSRKHQVLMLFVGLAWANLNAQNNTNYWQQQADYAMEIDMDVKKYQYQGKQQLTYTNHSPDTLQKVFYHLYFNAFQPGSEMDVRSRTIADPDPRVGDRISKLNEDEIGYIKVKSLKQNGKKINYEVVGTILEVKLHQAILPGEEVVFDMDFNGQVPQQIRRSGRQNKEGVELSMTQWYPKIAEYDFEGWHAHPYIGREFHGVWGDYDVQITIDKNYTIGGTGYLQNPNEIGHGYEDEGVKVKNRGKTKTWHFVAPRVHDFAWAADPDFVHDRFTAEDGTELHFIYKDKKEIKENWKKLQPDTEKMLLYFNEHIGPYPYDQYTIIQGGDGGMEYAMCTLITGERSYPSLFGVTAHELAHSWFQHVLATNESKHEWMDEGMTTYISTLAENEILEKEDDFPLSRAYQGYIALANSEAQQPLTSQADRWHFNQAYGISAYSKGAIFLTQLEYLIGEELLNKTLKRYFEEWKFKHPTPNDFKRVAEKVSGAELDWYLVDWTQTINTIDYGIKNASQEDDTLTVELERIGMMPMPIELAVTFEDDTQEMHYIPLQMMRWNKPGMENVHQKWAWAMPTYNLSIDVEGKQVKQIEIDPSQLMADINRENNVQKL